MVVGPSSIPPSQITGIWPIKDKSDSINEKKMQCKWIGGCVNHNYKFEKSIPFNPCYMLIFSQWNSETYKVPRHLVLIQGRN